MEKKGRLVSKPFTVEVKVPERTKIVSEIKRLRSALPTEREFAFIEETSEEDAARVREVSNVVLLRVGELERLLNGTLKATRERTAAAHSFRNEQLSEQQHAATVKWLQHEAEAMDYLLAAKQAAEADQFQKKAARESRAQEARATRDELMHRRLAPLKAHISDWSARMAEHDHHKDASFLQRSHEVARASNDRRSTLEQSASRRLRDSQFESSFKEDTLYQKLLEGSNNRERSNKARLDRNALFAQRYPTHVQEVRKKMHDHFSQKAALSDASLEASRSRRQQLLSQLASDSKSSNDHRLNSAAERASAHFGHLQSQRERKWSSIRQRFDEIRSREKDQSDQISQMRIAHSNELSFRGTKNSGSVSPTSTMRTTTPGSFSYFSNNDDDTAKTGAVADRLISRILKAANSGKGQSPATGRFSPSDATQELSSSPNTAPLCD